MKKRIVFLTGAGISVESGLSTFRGNNGMWDKYPVQMVASHEGWLTDPALVTEFYNERRAQLGSVQPNEAHRIIARMEADWQVDVVTQNVDDLHERAGSTHVVHLHGELMKVCSSRDVEDPRYQQTLTPETARIEPGTRCGDGSLLRPYIVFFGEPVPQIETAIQLVQQADILVVIGTSLVVYPAAGLINYTHHGVPVYVIDPSPVEAGTGENIHYIQTTATQGMQQLLKTIV